MITAYSCNDSIWGYSRTDKMSSVDTCCEQWKLNHVQALGKRRVDLICSSPVRNWHSRHIEECLPGGRRHNGKHGSFISRCLPVFRNVDNSNALAPSLFQICERKQTGQNYQTRETLSQKIRIRGKRAWPGPQTKTWGRCIHPTSGDKSGDSRIHFRDNL